MRGRPQSKKPSPDQEKAYVKRRIQEFAAQLNQAPAEDRLALLREFQHSLQNETKGFSAEAKNYRFQALRILNKNYHETARQAVQSYVGGTVKTLETTSKQVQAKAAPAQAQAFQTVKAEATPSFFARALRAISGFFGFKSADKPKSLEIQAAPPRAEAELQSPAKALIGAAPNIAGPIAGSAASYAEPIAAGMLGEIQAQTVMDALEAEAAASSNHLPSYEGEPISFGSKEDVKLTDLNLAQASALASAIDDAEARVNSEGVATSLALDIHETLTGIKEGSYQIADALKRGISPPGSTLSFNSGSHDPNEPSPNPND